MRGESWLCTQQRRFEARRSRTSSFEVRAALVGVVGGAVLAGCIDVGAAGGVTAHGGGPRFVEESVRVGFAVPPVVSPRQTSSGGEFGVEMGFGQRLDAPGSSLRLGLFWDLRIYPSALAWGDALRAFPTVGASFEGMEVDGYRRQLGLLAHAGFGLRYALNPHVGTSLILETQGGFLATVRPDDAPPEPELPLAAYGGVRLRLSLDLIALGSPRW